MRLRWPYGLALLLLLGMRPPCCCAWWGKVVGVSDGDTLTALHDNRPEKIRLYGIDAPEYNQAFGARAKKFAAQKAYGKQVRIEPVATDSNGRTVGLVFIGATCLNEELIKNGFAWVYRHFCHRPVCKAWLQLEDDSRTHGRGLWSDPHPTPPWKFRHANGKTGAAPAASSGGRAAWPAAGVSLYTAR